MEYIGQWWIEKDEELTGILKFDNENFKLELLGSFGEDWDFNPKNCEYIYGFTKCGNKITLIDCMCVGMESSMPGIPSTSYSPRDIIIGDKYYKSSDDINLKHLELRLDYLDEWIGESSATIKMNREEKKIDMKSQTLESIKYHTDIFDLNYVFCNHSSMNSTFTKYTWSQTSSIEINFKNDTNYTEAVKQIYNLEDFLSFCIGKPVEVRDIKATDNEGNNLKIIEANTLKPTKYMNKSEISNVLLHFQDIKDNFSSIYSLWIQKKERLQPIIRKMLSSEKESKYYDIQLHYMNIITALETFSRRFMNNCQIDSEDYENKKTYIINSIKDEDRKWLLDRLKYANEPTLNMRIKEIFKLFNDIIQISGKKRKSIINKTINTRNYYTHFGEDKRKEEMFTIQQSFYVYEFYKLILKLLILKELGIDPMLIMNNPNKKYVRELQAINELKKEFKIKSN
ncbi:hypothetical protein KCK39_001748 [Clostridium perfringens]|nr:hypothetical protein [Clostridium perfringens]